MDRLVENPGLSFLAVDIFTLLDIPSLLRCRLVCKSWKFVIEERLLWKKKMEYFRSKYGQLFFYYWPEWKEMFDIFFFSHKTSSEDLMIFSEIIEGYLKSNQLWNVNPLHYASSIGKPEYVKLLWPFLEKKCCQSRDYGHNPLHLAVESGNLELGKFS